MPAPKSTPIKLSSGTGSRARLQDIANLCGVGIATVDRVINERGNVSDETAEKVLNAARRLKLKRILPASHRRLLRIEVLLARPELPLIDRMSHEFARLSERIDRSVVIQRKLLKSEAPSVLAEQISATKCNAVIVYAQEHPAIHDAIATNLGRGVPTVTMISDLRSWIAYAGTNHYSAGKTAGFFMARMVAQHGPVYVLCNNLAFQSHEQRVRGFADALNFYGSHLWIAEILQGGDDSDKSERLLRTAFQAHSDTLGIYNVGAANDAVGSALRRNSFRTRPVFIGHELTHETRPMLQDGTMTLAIDQNPESQARFAVDVLLHHFDYTDHTWLEKPYKSHIPFTLYSRENLPEYLPTP